MPENTFATLMCLREAVLFLNLAYFVSLFAAFVLLLLATMCLLLTAKDFNFYSMCHFHISVTDKEDFLV